MAGQPRQPLSRLFIPPSLNSQQPMNFENGPMFSPALPTSITHGMHPPFVMNGGNPLQTPMQPGFFPPPGAPGRPQMHRSHPSMMQLAAAGILPPPGMPMTPLGQNGFPQPMMPGLAPFAQPFVPRSKRSASMSVGGPPKAVLGGPQRKVSPMPPIAAAAPAPAPTKAKKVVVNLPRETIPAEGDEPEKRAAFARNPLPPSQAPDSSQVKIPETSTVELYPPDSWRYHLPPTVDVFLPGKSAWDVIKQRVIEEKLQKLGVERGSGSSVPNILAPHARAASISSPADPALLFFKLNKLQQSQTASAASSLATSPQPPGASISPNQLPPRLQNRHGHSLSLAQNYNTTGSFNPFGPLATLGSDQIDRTSPAPIRPLPDIIHAPQGRVPTNVSSLAPPVPLSRPQSGPDFRRGFGLDSTEEEEEPEEEVAPAESVVADMDETADTTMDAADDTDNEGEREDGVSTVGQSRVHSRHVSKLSVALSLRSVGGLVDGEEREVVPTRTPEGDVMVDDIDVDPDQEAAGEWTGSEDLRTETSDDESIGEWSNPSDEERARHERLHRRMLRRVKQVKQELEIPRRLPNFPRPPPTLAAAKFLDDDIVSNPSDEDDAYFSRPASNHSSNRPLPPLPHSRSASQYSAHTGHDPALAHSRSASEQYLTPGGLHPRPPPSNPTRVDASLNPFAKPFVFGAQRQSNSWAPSAFQGVPNVPSMPTGPEHHRTPSLGKPLNATAHEFKPGGFNIAAPEFKPGGFNIAAPEFKPGGFNITAPEFKPAGFTFQPPPGIPQLAFSAPPAPPRPLPTPPPTEPVRATQGREKRQRRGSGSVLDGEDDDGFSTMTSFKFPPPTSDEAQVLRHSAPASPPASGAAKEFSFNAAGKPFTFSGFSGSLPHSAKPNEALKSPAYSVGENDENKPILPPTIPVPQEGAEELPFPPTAKPKRAPIPLDFKHPVSTNTVPAGLFKALVNNEDGERTRRTVRSRLSSRDIYEHSPRPSLDDLHVPTISKGMGRNRLFTDPGFRDTSPEPDDVFSVRKPRRSSMPSRRHEEDEEEDDFSDVSIAPVNLAKRVEMQQYELRLERLLEEKFETVKDTLREFSHTSGGQALNASTEAMIADVVSLFRSQLQDSATRALDDGHIDAKGEFDFELLKGIIEQANKESRATIHRDITMLLDSRSRDGDVRQVLEEISNRTINTLASAMSQIGARLQSMDASRQPAGLDREHLTQDLLNALMPRIASLRTEPVDYDLITAQLSEAVKPHISQLIDLASDKRETAGLIVDRLVPILPSLQPRVDLDAIVGRLTSELRTIVGPLDAHEIKEQVSDLVVERLDSRLSVRDRAFSVDALAEKVAGNLSAQLSPLEQLSSKLDSLAQVQSSHPGAAPVVQQVDLSSLKQDIVALLSDLPQQLGAATAALSSAQNEFKTRPTVKGSDDALSKTFSNVEATIASVASDQKKIVSANQEFSDFCQDIVRHINALPEAMVEATKVLQNAHAEFATRDTSHKDAEEIRRIHAANAELQVQLAKARGAHGQVRVEKDMLGERLKVVEVERERLSARVETLQSGFSQKAAESAATEAKNMELQEALGRALDRLKAADVQAQSHQERVAELEKAKNALSLETMQLKLKVDSLESRVESVTHEKQSLYEELSSQRRQTEDALAQQNGWGDELRRATEQIQTLATMVGQVDTEELKELRRVRDRSKVLEGEHAALQRRVKEYETKVANNEKIVATSRQTLAQAQQRAVEWERRAKENGEQVEVLQSKLDSIEQTQAQLDADYSLVKLQLEERDAEERLDKDRQNKLRDQNAALEAQVARLQAELDQAKKATSMAPTRYQNGHGQSHPPPRPDSRTSTIYDHSRSGTPTGHYNGSRTTTTDRTSTPPQPSVWDSIHAPRQARLPVTPKPKRAVASRPYYPRAPSPAPSNVSAAPTLGDDGWWQ